MVPTCYAMSIGKHLIVSGIHMNAWLLPESAGRGANVWVWVDWVAEW